MEYRFPLWHEIFGVRRSRHFGPGTALTLMGLNAIVFLDIEPFSERLRDILGCESLDQVESPAPFVPAVIEAKRGNEKLFGFEGTRGISAWWAYVTGAGSAAYGPAPGRVFAPFREYAAALQPTVNRYLAKGDTVLLTGHSLGGATAALLQTTLTTAGWHTLPAWCFACPRYGDAAMLAAFRGGVYNVNLPNDPVPLLPPDVVYAVTRDPAGLAWGDIYSRAGGALTLESWVRVAQTPDRLDFLVQLAAANVVPNQSPHNTYQYLRSCVRGLPKPWTDAQTAYIALLAELGLMDPWP